MLTSFLQNMALCQDAQIITLGLTQMYRFTSTLIRGRLIKRYKRFLADITLDSGETITAHCPNTGAMTGCAQAGAVVYVSTSDNPKRKYAHTWEYSSDAQGNLIGINTANANRAVKAALLERRIPEFHHYANVLSEQTHGDSRLDFLLTEDGAPDAYIEVKSATLAEGNCAFFPDTQTLRGRKHCEQLASIAQLGHAAFLLFCIQRENITHFSVARDIDPKYAEALEYAKENGVQILAYTCNMTPLGIEIADPVQIS
ncbi:DNA/RNA nuclease SfsA [Glaciecola siphonariae]|uniref:Sugar fermentation stimulation protein homolog n=1 Tax=Glaciecola siphonariae TaxID=521012 RepID=A0ABV9LX72_9ALTE